MPTTIIEKPTDTTTSTTLYISVQESVEKVRSALEVLKTKVLENESVSAAAVKTNKLIETARTHAETALTSVRENVPASTSEALAKVQSALAQVTPLLEEVKAFSAASLESANQAIKKALEVVTTWKSVVLDFALQRVSSLDTTFQLSSKTVEWANIASEQTKLLDTKYSIAENVEKVTAKAKELDELYSLQEKTLDAAKKCQEIGDRLTGARITPLVDYMTTLAVRGYSSSVESVKLVTDVVVNKAAEQKSTNLESKESKETVATKE